MAKVEMFRCLNPRQIEMLIAKMVFQKHARGNEVVKEGASADALYVMIRGECGVYSKCAGSMRLSTLHALDFFGENSLVSGAHDNEGQHTRNATCVVESETAQTLKLPAAAFKALVNSGMLGDEIETILKTARSVSLSRHSSNIAAARGNDPGRRAAPLSGGL